MRKHLKNYFIPHEHNDFKPHFWRQTSLNILLLIVFATFVSTFLLQKAVNNSGLSAQVLPSVLTRLTNEDRLNSSLVTLKESEILIAAATMKGSDMRDKQYFAHTSPEGVTPWYWFEKAGYRFFYAGENLAIRFTDSKAVEDAWLSSPTHRKNIMDPRFTEIGIAAVDGVYQGTPTTFVVQLFAMPAEIKESAKPVVVKQTSTPEVKNNQVVVKGAEAEIVQNNPKVEKISETASGIVVKTADENLLPASTGDQIQESNKVSFNEKIVVNPASFLKLVYLFVGSIMFIALTLFVFIEIRKQHFKNILAGLGILSTMFISYYVFVYFIGRQFVFI